MQKQDKKQVKIALAQTTICWEAKEENYRKAEKRLQDAVMQGARAVFSGDELYGIFHEYQRHEGV